MSTTPTATVCCELLEPVVGGRGPGPRGRHRHPGGQAAAAAGRRRQATAGSSLDDVAEVSQAVSAALDAADAMGGTPYVLEVTSPGVDRPLTEPRHWRRAVGRLVKVRPRDGGDRSPAGSPTADETRSVLDVDGQGRADVDYAEVDAGRGQVEFNRAERADDRHRRRRRRGRGGG